MAKSKIETFKVGELEITIDRNKCLSCGTCSALAPKTFIMDDNFLISVNTKPPFDSEKQIMAAANSCPNQAVIVKNSKS